MARYAWPAGVAAAGAAWYAADSLRHRREGGHGYRLRGEVDVREASFLRAAESLTGAPVSYGNDAEILINGDQIFPAYVGAIRDAEETVNLTTYAYWRGDIATEVADTLCEKASAGVECNVIVDAVGAAQMDRKLVHKMRDAGVNVCFFRPPKPYAVRRLQYRNHRKLLIVDGTTGFTGGVGIAEEWTGNAEDPDHWRDTHVRVTRPGGPRPPGRLRRELARVHRRRAGGRPLPALHRGAGGRRPDAGDALERHGRGLERRGAHLPRGGGRQALDRAHLRLLRAAPRLHRGARGGAERGVHMRILVPGSHIDKQFVRTAGRAAYDQLIEAGIEIYEYCPTMLHAKTLTVDEIWSSVGSVNFDNRSFQLHDEVTLCVQSERFAGELHEVFERDLEDSERIEPDEWRERPITQRARENVTKYARREL